MTNRHDDRRLASFTVALAIVLGVFIRLMLGDAHDDIGPATVPTILPPPALWTATPPYSLSLAEIKR